MKTTAKEFDESFDNNQDITKYLDQTKTKKLSDFEKLIKTKKVNVDFPEDILNQLDFEAKRIGVTRQSIIKVWIAERLKEEQRDRLVS